MERVVYRKLNQTVRDDGRIPESSDLDCCHCGKPYKCPPVPVVGEFDHQRGHFSVYHLACTLACAKSYIIATSGEWRHTLLMYQRTMLNDVYGLSSETPIQPARSLDALKSRGGHMSLEEWRKPQDGTKPLCVSVDPRFVPHKIVLRMATCDADAAREDEDEAAAVASGGIPEAARRLKNMTTFNLQRPPEEGCIKTIEDLRRAYPTMKLASDDPGPFERWIEENNGKLPPEAECVSAKKKRQEEKSAKRKRKAPRGGK